VAGLVGQVLIHPSHVCQIDANDQGLLGTFSRPCNANAILPQILPFVATVHPARTLQTIPEALQILEPYLRQRDLVVFGFGIFSIGHLA
jgi:hypothetical protein